MSNLTVLEIHMIWHINNYGTWYFQLIFEFGPVTFWVLNVDIIFVVSFHVTHLNKELTLGFYRQSEKLFLDCGAFYQYFLLLFERNWYPRLLSIYGHKLLYCLFFNSQSGCVLLISLITVISFTPFHILFLFSLKYACSRFYFV